MIITLHTWGRSLSFHPHVHVLITAGGLDDAGQWQDPKRSCLLPLPVVMAVFKGKWRGLMIQALKSGALRRPPPSSAEQVMSCLNKCGRKKWNIHFRNRYDYSEGVLKYLSRYVRGGPLKSRQLTFKDERVHFQYQPHYQKGPKQTPFVGEKLVGRYLQHLPVPRQHSVRYYGLYAPRAIDRLNRARTLLGQDIVVAPPTLEWGTYLEKLFGITEHTHCPSCGAALTSTPQSMTPRSRAPPDQHAKG
ncbi:transposase [Pseudomonadota bacterium]